MIIWRGKGIVVALLAFGCLVVSELITRAVFGDEKYYQTHGWPMLGAFGLLQGWSMRFARGSGAEKSAN
jgi:hypothetical protein